MNDRTPEFTRNDSLEDLLREINTLLQPVEGKLAQDYSQPKRGVVLVVGCCRSGTTLALQWLASTGRFAYPTNLLSRFYGAPAVGARIQLLLTDPRFQFRDELADIASDVSFSSNLGKTSGVLAPNEFWYFWRRFIPNKEPRYLTAEEEETIDGRGLAAELAAIEAVFEKPFAAKGMILQYNIPKLATILDKVIFLHVRRHPFYNIQSLLEAREKFHGSRDKWYSAKPKEYASLEGLSPIAQVAGQVYYTNKAIDDAFQQLDEVRSLSVDYEGFCQNPESVYRDLQRRLDAQGCIIDRRYTGPGSFESTNVPRVSEDDVRAICDTYEELSGETLSP